LAFKETRFGKEPGVLKKYQNKELPLFLSSYATLYGTEYLLCRPKRWEHISEQFNRF